MPFQTASWAAANGSTTPRMGPTHGVHPKAKANPMTNAPQADELPLRLWSRVSASSALICRIPVKWRPKRMMTAPAMRASSDLYCARTWPTSVEIAPSVMKTILKPMMKAAELSITLRKSSPSFSFNCSTPTPEIRETYPGTSGSTQGDKNEISPATKAASGNGKLVISLYCSDRGEVAPCLQDAAEGGIVTAFPPSSTDYRHLDAVTATRAFAAASGRAGLAPRPREELRSKPSG